MKPTRLLLAMAVTAVVAAPAAVSATAIGFTYSGADADDRYVTAQGSGTISFNGSGALSLNDLTNFSFMQTTVLSDPSLLGSGTFTYGLGDVLGFNAVFNGATLTSLSLRTRTEADPTGFLADQAFQVRSLAVDGATTSFDASGGDEATVGSVRVAAAVPEPSMWALMVLGFGMVGASARRRRGIGHGQPQPCL